MKAAEDAENTEILEKNLVCFLVSPQTGVRHEISSPFVLSVLCGFGLSSPPIADFLQSLAAGVFKKAHPMARVFEFVDVGPNLGLPSLLVRGRFATGSATRVQSNRDLFDPNRRRAREFHEDAAYFLDFFVGAEQVLIAQEISEP